MLLGRRKGDDGKHAVDRGLQGEVGGDQLQMAGFDLREIENIVEEDQQRIGRVLDGFEILLLFRIHRRIEQDGGHADDAIHRGADFVAHVGQKFTLETTGFECAVEQRLGLLQQCFHAKFRFRQFHRPFGHLALQTDAVEFQPAHPVAPNESSKPEQTNDGENLKPPRLIDGRLDAKGERARVGLPFSAWRPGHHLKTIVSRRQRR